MQFITEEEKIKKHMEVDKFITEKEFLEDMVEIEKQISKGQIYTHEEFRKIIDNNTN